MPRTSVRVTLPMYLDVILQKLSVERDRAKSDLILEAVRARFGADQDNPAPDIAWDEPALIKAADRLLAESLIQKEMMLVFIRLWFEHTPPIEEHLEDSCARSANAQFERFLDGVAAGLAANRQRGEDLVYHTGNEEADDAYEN